MKEFSKKYLITPLVLLISGPIMCVSVQAEMYFPWFWFSPMNWGSATKALDGDPTLPPGGYLPQILTITVDDPATPTNPDYEGLSDDPYIEGDVINFGIHGFNARGGHAVTVTGETNLGDIVSKTLVVHKILPGADFDSDVIYGWAATPTPVSVEIEIDGLDYWPSSEVDTSGLWSVDFAGLGFDLPAPPIGVTIHQWDDDSDSTDLHWTISTVPALRCEGFGAPLDTYPVTVRGNRALPLKAKLFSALGTEMTGYDLLTPPVAQVIHDSGAGEAVDVTDEALPSGLGDEGNQFFYEDGFWKFVLKTKHYSAPGTYTVTLQHGDDQEYQVMEYLTCFAQFVRN